MSCFSITLSGQTHPASAGLHGAENQELYSVFCFSICVRDIVNLWVETVEKVVVIGAGALLNEGTHTAYWHDAVQLLL